MSQFIFETFSSLALAQIFLVKEKQQMSHFDDEETDNKLRVNWDNATSKWHCNCYKFLGNLQYANGKCPALNDFVFVSQLDKFGGMENSDPNPILFDQTVTDMHAWHLTYNQQKALCNNACNVVNCNHNCNTKECNLHLIIQNDDAESMFFNCDNSLVHDNMKPPIPKEHFDNKNTNYKFRWDMHSKIWYLENTLQSNKCGNADTSVAEMVQNLFKYSHKSVNSIDTKIIVPSSMSSEINVIKKSMKEFEQFLNAN